MLCGGNTAIIWKGATWDETAFSVGPTFFVPPSPPRGGHPRKKISHPVSKFFSSPPPPAAAREIFSNTWGTVMREQGIQ